MLSYGDSVAAGTIQSSTITDFEVGVDTIGLIGVGADNVTLDTLLSQTNIAQQVVDDDLLISVGGFQIAVLDGVAGVLGAESFMTASQYVAPLPVEVSGTDGVDTLVGTDGVDVLSAFGGDDRLIGQGGNDRIFGGDGQDTINGGSGNNAIQGGDGDADGGDLIYAGTGHDTVNGGYGDDVIHGMNGNDVLQGGYGADVLNGHGGNDMLSGNAGSDLISGGAGNDFLNGGFGNDRLNGGTQADTFFHAGAAGHGTDWVQDYTAADGDVLVFGIAGASVLDFQVNIASAGSGDAAIDEAFVLYQGDVIWALVDGAGQDSLNLTIAGNAEVFDLLAIA